MDAAGFDVQHIETDLPIGNANSDMDFQWEIWSSSWHNRRKEFVLKPKQSWSFQSFCWQMVVFVLFGKSWGEEQTSLGKSSGCLKHCLISLHDKSIISLNGHQYILTVCWTERPNGPVSYWGEIAVGVLLKLYSEQIQSNCLHTDELWSFLMRVETLAAFALL